MPWSVTILDQGDGLLQVTWLTEAGAEAFADRERRLPVGRRERPATHPRAAARRPRGDRAHDVHDPYAGGTQPITGEVSDGGDGFFNTGTITVTPAGVAAARE